MPGIEWLIIKEGKTKEVPKTSRNSPIFSALFYKERMPRYLLAGRCQKILKWTVHCVKVTDAKLQKQE